MFNVLLGLFGYELPAIDWKETRDFVSTVAFFLAASAAFIGVVRINKIWLALQEFRKSKSDLTGLLEAVQELENLIPKLRLAKDDLGEDVADLKRVQALPSAAAPQSEEDRAEEERWQAVRGIWREVRDKLEEIVQGLDGRKRRPYNEIPRRNYGELIEKLRDSQFLSPPRAQVAKKLNDRFHQVKSRQTPVTPDDERNFRQWRREFDESL